MGHIRVGRSAAMQHAGHTSSGVYSRMYSASNGTTRMALGVVQLRSIGILQLCAAFILSPFVSSGL